MRKKQLGMYTISVEDDGSLKIQAPTLLRPLVIEARQVQDLRQFLNETVGGETPAESPPTIVPIPNAPMPASPSQIPVTPLASHTVQSNTAAQNEQAPVTESSETPEETAQRVIHEIIYHTQNNYPSSLAPENRDRFIEQITRNPGIRPLMSKGKISYKQVLMWVEQRLGTRL